MTDQDKYSATFTYSPPKNAESEFGSSPNIRWLLNGSEPRIIERCIDCEAKSHIFKLHDIQVDEEHKNYRVIVDALLFILENTDWPVGDGKDELPKL